MKTLKKHRHAHSHRMDTCVTTPIIYNEKHNANHTSAHTHTAPVNTDKHKRAQVWGQRKDMCTHVNEQKPRMHFLTKHTRRTQTPGTHAHDTHTNTLTRTLALTH
eukprot:GDKI01024997.1.p1 GENE.GDKI01024997.1~~GDKI01024997.1.p1  ORF type:complete len:105 (-),score=15.27 GDKI01024997.1:64-378(-)